MGKLERNVENVVRVYFENLRAVHIKKTNKSTIS